MGEGGAPQPTAPAERLESLTALRAAAAFAVFTTHVGMLVVHDRWVQRVTAQGVSGVSFFFILSGFVLTWSYRPPVRGRTFYRRRFARIYPAYLVALVLGAAVNGWVHGFGHLHLRPSIAAVFLVQSWVPRTAYYYVDNSVAWSLSTEAFFYLLFPLLIRGVWALGPRARGAALGALVLAAIAVPVVVHTDAVNGGTPFWFIYIFPPVRLIEFVIGMLLALHLRRGGRVLVGRRAATALALAAYAAAGWVPPYLRWEAATIIPLSLLVLSVAGADAVRAPSVLRAPALVRLGTWSYSFYLVHFLVLIAIAHVVGTPATPVAMALAAGALMVSTLLAAGLHYTAEVPLERALRGAAPRSTRALVAAPPPELPAPLAQVATPVNGSLRRLDRPLVAPRKVREWAAMTGRDVPEAELSPALAAAYRAAVLVRV